MTDEMLTEEQGREIIALLDAFTTKWGNLAPLRLNFKVPRMSKAVHLDEYHALMRASLDRFIEHWRTEHGDAPNDWPIMMPLGEWDEQFLAWVDDSAS